ncbi:MAG TPA: erythromycin esterase family protein [Chitinophagaceae bacterium]|nr:erythromycin esterase family protein [Chitinophagaceae bacterium]
MKDETHSYILDLKTGECATLVIMQKEVNVAVDIFYPTGQKLETVNSPDESEEQINIEAIQSGKYSIHIYPFTYKWSKEDITSWKNQNPGKNFDSLLIAGKLANQGNYAISYISILSAADCRKKIDWLTQNTHPLKTVHAGSGFQDLQWLKPVLKDVKYVGLGEATHGTREFFQMNHRMLEFLIKEMGFTVLATEGSYQGFENINNYILYGKGDPYTALTSTGVWPFDTEEIISVIEWIHNYNKTVSEKKKVSFLGFDLQRFGKSGAIDSIRNYLRKVDTILNNQKDSLLQVLHRRDYDGYLYSTISDTVREEVSDILVSLTIKKGDYVNRSSKEEYQKNFWRTTNLLQFMGVFDRSRLRQQRNSRDYYMAVNFFNFVQQNPDKKIVLWAHASHLSQTPVSPALGTPPMGSYLKQVYGSAYYPVTYVFNKGSFHALYWQNGQRMGLKEFTVTEAKEGTLDWYLARAKDGDFMINLRQKSLPIFFSEKRLQTRWFGGGISSDENYNNAYTTITAGKDFDAIIFIKTTTRTTPTPTGKR